MNNKNYDWLSKRTIRTVDELRLWPDNPRLNPEEDHKYISDYAEDLTSDDGERDGFCNLVKSIAEIGFIPSDPIVVWQNEQNKKFFVAEGNRRILAMKLLRHPEKAPKSIRAFIRKYAVRIDKETIRKVYVSIAPSLEAAEWYINQRNSTSSLRRSWSRVQQQRWIASLYEKYKDDIDKMLEITSMNKSDIESYIRILKIKDYIKKEEIRNLLTAEEFDKANSYRFPITILERFFGYADVKRCWGIEFEGTDIRINAEIDTFNKAFVELIKQIVAEKINTRMKAADAPSILDKLPQVVLSSTTNNGLNEQNSEESVIIRGKNEQVQPNSSVDKMVMKNDPYRKRLILSIYDLNTTDTKLRELFEELKNISTAKYAHSTSAAIRVFLDISVRNYIVAEGLEQDICKQCKNTFSEITLQKRLSYLKDNKLSGSTKTIVEKLLNPSNQFSLDVLNSFIHSSSTSLSYKEFLNRFWDFLFPLFEILLDVKENSIQDE